MNDFSEKIERDYEEQLTWGNPINYKGINLYPVTCKNIYRFNLSIYPLLYNPLRYPTEISTLPRLYFLTDILNYQQDILYLQNNIFLLQMHKCLLDLLTLVLKDQKFEFVNNNGKWFLRVDTVDNKKIDVKVKDFEMIRQIILHQNGIAYDDTFVHEDIRKWIDEQEKADKSPKAITEDYIEVYLLQSGLQNIKKIKKVPLRRFNRIIDKILSRENYVIQTTASMSGFVTFKGKIDHWLVTNKKNSIYDKYFKEIK